MTSPESFRMIPTTAPPTTSAGWTVTAGALTASLRWLAVCGNYEPKWQPFPYDGLIRLGLGKHEEKRRTVPARQQIEVSF